MSGDPSSDDTTAPAPFDDAWIETGRYDARMPSWEKIAVRDGPGDGRIAPEDGSGRPAPALNRPDTRENGAEWGEWSEWGEWGDGEEWGEWG
jgi:hypothetical protein